MQAHRWKNLLIPRNFLSSYCHSVLFYSTPACHAKWDNDTGGQQSSKTYIKYVTHHKSADAKKALKNILNGSSSYRHSINSFQGLDFNRGFEETSNRTGEKKHKQARSKRSGGGSRAHRSLHGGRKHRQRKDGFVSDYDEDPETFFEATFGGKCVTWSFRSSEDHPIRSSTYGFQLKSDGLNWSKSNTRYWGSSDETDDIEDDEDEQLCTIGSSNDRTVLGLPPWGPIDVGRC